MALRGEAVLALWWDVAPAHRAELAHWHAHEHFPERLALPGFLRASRWTSVDDDGSGFFVLYELQDPAVLASPAYVARLNAPSPWSTRMMPLHAGMVRSQCRVLCSRGALTARHALAIRFSPAPDAAAVRAFDALAADVAQRPGLVGLHLLGHQPPALATTTEQQIRGNADRAADAVIVACGYELDALRALGAAELADARLQAAGAGAGIERRFYALAYAALPSDPCTFTQETT
jgi:hypothetical protein